MCVCLRYYEIDNVT